jgi:hypothetical protein
MLIKAQHHEDVRASGGTAPFLISAVVVSSLPLSLYPAERAAVPTGEEGEWALEPVWNVWNL